jgi:hypothetical protein
MIRLASVSKKARNARLARSADLNTEKMILVLVLNVKTSLDKFVSISAIRAPVSMDKIADSLMKLRLNNNKPVMPEHMVESELMQQLSVPEQEEPVNSKDNFL